MSQDRLVLESKVECGRAVCLDDVGREQLSQPGNTGLQVLAPENHAGSLASQAQHVALGVAVGAQPHLARKREAVVEQAVSQARGFSQLETGGIMAAMPLTMFVVAPLSGVLADRTGPRLLTTVAMALVAAGLLLMSTVGADTSVLGIVGRLIAIGIGTAIFSSPNTSAVMGSVRPDRLGTAAASATTSRTVGQAIGVAIAGALFAAGSGAIAESRLVLGQDDPAVAEAFVSGLQLALIVGAAIAAAGILTAWMRGSAPPGATASATADAMPRSGPKRAPMPVWGIERPAPQRGRTPGGGD